MKRVLARCQRHVWLVPAVIAIAVLSAACSVSPEARKQGFLKQGNQYFDKGEYRSAILEYRNAVSIDARYGEARAKLAESYLRIGDLANALAEFVRAADLLPNDFDVNVKAGTLLVAAGRADDALSKAEVAIKLKPQDVNAHILKGNALAGLKSFDEALKSIEEAIRLDPARGATFTQKAFIELASGRNNEAENTFKKSIELAPKAVEGYLALGNYYWSLGRAMETEQTFRAALKVKPDDPSANRAMAALSLATGRTGEAEGYLKTIADSSGDPGSVVALVNYYLLTGRSKDAIARLNVLNEKTPNLPGTQQLMARAYAADGNPVKARETVETILAGDRQNLDAQLLKGQLLFQDGKRDEALAEVKAAADAHPDSAEAQLLLGRVHAARGDSEPAEAAFREVIRINPRISAAQVELSKLLLAKGNVSDSLLKAREATLLDPTSLEARLALVRGLLASRDITQAEKDLAPLAAQYPDVADVQALVGVLAVVKNDIPGGRAAFERALVANPNSAEALAGVIALDLRAKNTAGATRRIDERLQANKSPEMLLLAARTYGSAGDLAAAERFLRQALEKDATMLPAYGMLAELYLTQGKLDDARKEFDTLAAKQTKPVAALTMSGIILQGQGQVALARKRFEDALAIDPRAPVAANNLAWIQTESGENLDIALQLAQSAFAVSPETPEITDTLGWIFYKKNRPQDAILQFEKSVAKAPANATFHYHLGLAYLQAGDKNRGRASLQKAMSVGPDTKTAADIKRLLSTL
jgi:putative PEP-CTERM system TPR-repeat lipoprotein